MCRQVSTRPVTPVEVFLKHGAPKITHDHEAYFGCPVRFDADADALLFTHSDMAQPNQKGDAGIVRFIDKHLDSELAGMRDHTSLNRRVKNAVSSSLGAGVPKISDVAGQLGMSGRTLQRRLSEQGLSFQSVVDGARRELAISLLRETNFPLTEVAFLVGFSEQSAFNRAFRRWAGETPRSYRLNAN
jgi:AraC-like DNA-binding protein